MSKLIQTHIQELITKAANAVKSEDAMRYSQSALNAAHAQQILDIIDYDRRKYGND